MRGKYTFANGVGESTQLVADFFWGSRMEMLQKSLLIDLFRNNSHSW